MITEIGAVLDADRAATGREHLWGPAAEQEMSIEDCFNASDAMISDVSAVVSDYLHSGKPFAIVSVGRNPNSCWWTCRPPRPRTCCARTCRISPASATTCSAPTRSPQLRIETKIYYLGDFPDENYAEGFLSAAREVIDAGRTLTSARGTTP